MKITAIIMLIFMLCACKGQNPTEIEENIRAVMVEGRLYYDTGLIPEQLPTCGTMDGEITSSVAEDELPEVNGQSNFGVGIGYQNYGHNEIIVLTDREDWSIFRCDDEWGITLTVRDVTPKGLTLVCTQKGGNMRGELQTGTPYTLESLHNGVWQAVELKVKANIAWTMQAFMIPKDDATDFEIDWSWLYGELPAGKYRIGKEITDYITPGEYEKTTYWAEFEI